MRTRVQHLLQYNLREYPVTDPLVTAAEAACHAIERGCSTSQDAATEAAEAMPPNSTEFERGLAAGIAFACWADEN